MKKIDKLTVRGFKSIKELVDFELRDLNVIVGANGAGKSNLIQIFRMVHAMSLKNFQEFINNAGGADAFPFNGLKETPQIDVEFKFGHNAYAFELKPTADERFSVSERGQLPDCAWMVYHFHDTSQNAPMRRSEIVEDSARLREDGANIAAFLKAMREDGEESRRAYQRIVETIRLVMPFFDDFRLDVVKNGAAEKVKLTWKQKGSDYPFQPYHLSDGSIRFICLATALLQPKPPSTIIIDEPELGLHPMAINIIAELMKVAAAKTQVVVATQSPLLIDQFGFEDIVVASRKEGATTFERLEEKDFAAWLDEFTIGEMLTNNIIQGGPSHE